MEAELRERIERAAAVLKSFGATEVYVFGSAATGKMHEGSDVDMAVVGLPAKVYFRALYDAGNALGRDLDLINLEQDNLFTRYLRTKGRLQRVA